MEKRRANSLYQKMHQAIIFLKAIYISKTNTNDPLYEYIDSYRDKDGIYIVVARIIGSAGKIFKAPAVNLVVKRKNILSGFNIDDIVNIVGLAAIEKEPVVIQKKPDVYKCFCLIAMLFVVFQIIANISAIKIISIFGITAPAGVFTYPLAYFFGNTVTEVYGYKRSRQLIWGATLCNIVFILASQILIALPGSSLWHHQHALTLILISSYRMFIASTIAFWSSEFINSYILARSKISYHGKRIWLRILSSSSMAIIVNSTVFCLIAYLPTMTNAELLKFIVDLISLKVAYLMLISPFMIITIAWLKNYEKIDIFDTETRFTPFSLDVNYETEKQ